MLTTFAMHPAHITSSYLFIESRPLAGKDPFPSRYHIAQLIHVTRLFFPWRKVALKVELARATR